MGRVRRGGYVITWWIGDHAPRHVHVRNAKGVALGRIDLATHKSLKGWKPPKDLVKILEDLEKEGRL